VSFRDGKYWNIDGQHRKYGAVKRNGGKDCVLMCRVHYGMTPLDEAMFFLHQGDGIAKITISDKLRVMYKIGDEQTMELVRGAVMAGWDIDNFNTKKGRGRIIAHSTLLRVYKALSYEQYVDMLKTVRVAWDGDPDSVCREMLLGMGLFYKTYWGKFLSSDLIKNMKKISPLLIVRDGRAIGNAHTSTGMDLASGRCYARCILREYNNGRKTKRLDDEL
jgi:hypothetical protein